MEQSQRSVKLNDIYLMFLLHLFQASPIFVNKAFAYTSGGAPFIDLLQALLRNVTRLDEKMI
jgi:hypothetical protein